MRGVFKCQLIFCNLFENVSGYEMLSTYFCTAIGHARQVAGGICDRRFLDLEFTYRYFFPASITLPTTRVSDVSASTRTFLAEKISGPP